MEALETPESPYPPFYPIDTVCELKLSDTTAKVIVTGYDTHTRNGEVIPVTTPNGVVHLVRTIDHEDGEALELKADYANLTPV